ncbi:ATP-binding cassette domain-containing protein [Acidithiobacillus sp. M4-SHS-6]|uniref:ATP-binding cassette domain-containing protein n=1 Tax=Acidithiobacillus sp. M4-SHS-6 TaxID=3383024 RepID=UPI0039BDED14
MSAAAESASEGHNQPPLLRLRGIGKRFGAVQALRDIDLDIWPGEVLALLGDNGAGKSTLIKIIAGAQAPTTGTMHFHDQAVRQFDPHYARDLGIETLYQDLAVAENLDVAANIFLGRERKKRLLGVFPILARREMRKESVLALQKLAIQLPLRQPVGELSGGQRQAVAIARAAYWQAKLVIMDEPTAAIGVGEHSAILHLIQTLAASSVAVILITHTMPDVWQVASRITVLTRGEKALDGRPDNLDEDLVVKAMLLGKGVAA